MSTPSKRQKNAPFDNARETVRGRTRLVRQRLGGSRGFTLIELLMAMVAGMLVSIAAFSFSKQSTRMFAREARIAATQMSVLSGFQKLQADVSRAAFLSTPDIKRAIGLHHYLCAPNYNSWPPSMRNLAGLRIAVEGSTTAAALPDGKRPDMIRVAGSLSTVEVFDVAGWGDDQKSITLRAGAGAMTRLGFTPGSDITRVFRPGRIVHVWDTTHDAYGIIASASYPSNGKPIVVLTDTIPVSTGGAPTGCMLQVAQGKTFLSVVSVVDYAIASLRNIPVYKNTVYSDAGTALGDNTRTELVRREVLLDNGEPPGIEQDPASEIVAEYAVDLRAGIWVSSSTPGSGLTYLPPSSTAINQVMNYAGPYSPGTLPSGPAAIRSVALRLVVRSREVDRTSPTYHEMTGAGLFHRVPVGGPNSPHWARVRTLTAEVSLMNQREEVVPPGM